MKSIYLRNFTATALLVLTCFILVAFSFVGIGRLYLIREYKSDMVASAEEVSRTAAAVGQNDSMNSWLLSMIISAISRSTGNHIFITDANGLVMSCSDQTPMCKHYGTLLPEDIMTEIKNGQETEISTLGGMYTNPRYIVTHEITRESDGELMGYVFVTNAPDNILSNWSTFVLIATVIAVLVLCMSLAVSLVYSKRMARPLDEIAAASRKFARGDFSVRVKQQEDPTDEMGALIDSFNKMADSLQNAENRRSEFIANVSHELRTPMTTIAGFADGILDGTIPHEQEEKYLRKIADETRRLSRLVRSMLDLSQAESDAVDLSKRSRFDLSELLLQCLLSFESRAKEKNLDVDPQLPEDPIEVFAERDSITQVIYNLTDNAMKFASPGSTITIRLYKKGSKAYVSIKNIGEPIPENDLPYIFDRFHKSDRSRSLDKDGVGLGLYLVKKIVNSHGEEVAVSSRDGVTVFVFTLPLAPAKQKKEKSERK